MKKTIIISAIMVSLGWTSTVMANSFSQAEQIQTVVVEAELTFSEVAIDKLPEAVVKAFAVEQEGVAITKAEMAKTAEGVVVYKISAEDAEGDVKSFLFKQDGSKYEK